MSKLGFGAAKGVTENRDRQFKVTEANTLMSTVANYRQRYPQNKFITEAEVKRLCEKYGLMLGDAARYVGDIPEKNLRELEAFKLRKDDYPAKEMRDILFTGFSGALRDYERQMIGIDWGMRNTFRDSFAQQVLPSEPAFPATENPGFKICAPKSDFNTVGLIEREGYRLEEEVKDPIVLQPVRGGYLIVTAWGPEASDPMVVDEGKN